MRGLSRCHKCLLHMALQSPTPQDRQTPEDKAHTQWNQTAIDTCQLHNLNILSFRRHWQRSQDGMSGSHLQIERRLGSEFQESMMMAQ